MIYSFKCQKCGEVGDINMSVATYERTNWDKICCDEPCFGELKRVWSDTPIHFKGSGWTVKSK